MMYGLDHDICLCSAETGCTDNFDNLVRSGKICYRCRGLDPYAPCPRLGFGCGTGGNTDRCDCCTDAQWAAAGGLK